MNNYFELLPEEIRWDISLLSTYDEILNSCEAHIVEVCNNPDFWWRKLNFEIHNHNITGYDVYQFLYETLYMNRYKYFEGALKNYNLNEDKVIHLFFCYGFAIDNINIMKKYATTDRHNLYKAYKNNQDYSDILLNGYYTLDELYKIIELALQRDALNEIVSYIRPHIKSNSDSILPIRYHPRRHIFDKLILRYIGIDTDQDIINFQVLIYIYTEIVASKKELYNLIFKTYHISTINFHIFSKIYKDFEGTFLRRYGVDKRYGYIKMLETEDISIDVSGIQYDDDFGVAIVITDSLNYFKISRDINYTTNYDLVYNNGKIIDYLINTNLSEELPTIIEYLAKYKLSISQFKQCIQKFNEDEFNKFVYLFMVYYNATGDRYISGEIYDVHYFKKMEILMNNDMLSYETIKRICKQLHDKNMLFVRDKYIFLRDINVRRIIRQLKY